ncbi:MAG: response regulator [Acidobacteria bacterium]|nr:response regulator [Acidobacteriota bacterium]
MALFDKVWQQMSSRLDQAKLTKEIERLQLIIQTKPNDTEALRQLGTLYETCAMTQEAIGQFVHLAQAYSQINQSQLAIAYYQKAERLSKDEQRASLLKEIEKIYHQTNQYDEAYKVARQVIEIYLELNQKEAARGFVQSLSSYGEKDAIYRKELKEIIGEKDESWAQGARGSWISENTIRPTQNLTALPGYSSAKVPISSDKEKERFSQLKVLIVDDDAGIIKIMTAMLKMIGCQIVAAFDGQEGLEKALEHLPDLIISDLLMPKMDGSQLFDRLREFPKTASIPFVCLTSRGQEDEKLAAFEKGVEDYWVKPFVISELSMKTKKILLRQLEKSQKEISITPALASSLGQTVDLAGNLATTPLPQLLRIIEYMSKTGILTLQDNKEGKIFFQQGIIYHASYEDFQGESAILALLPLTDGTFSFFSQSITVSRTIFSSLDDLFKKLNEC